MEEGKREREIRERCIERSESLVRGPCVSLGEYVSKMSYGREGVFQGRRER